jgi:hypothetical protein
MVKHRASIQHVDHASPGGEIENVLDDISPAEDMQEMVDSEKPLSKLTAEQQQKLQLFYQRKSAQAEDIAPDADIMHIFGRIQEMSEDEALEILVQAIEFHKDDQNFPEPTMTKIKVLVQGPKASSGISTDYDFDLKAEAAIIHYHSPYPEVRSVTDAFDDPTIPVETFRAYFLGLTWMAGATALNTFFSPRQLGNLLSHSAVPFCNYCWRPVASFSPEFYQIGASPCLALGIR